MRPVLGDLEWMEGDVPTPQGMIHVYMDRQQVKVSCTANATPHSDQRSENATPHSDQRSENQGWLIVGNQRVKIEAHQETTLKL